MVCKPGTIGGLAGFRVGATPAHDAVPGRGVLQAANAGVWSQANTGTGHHPAGTLAEIDGAHGGSTNRRDCRPTSIRPRLSRRALVGPVLTSPSDEHKCFVSGRIVIRVRVVRNDDGKVTAAYLAVAAERTRRPLAFASLDAQRRTRLFVSPRCES